MTPEQEQRLRDWWDQNPTLLDKIRDSPATLTIAHLLIAGDRRNRQAAA